MSLVQMIEANWLIFVAALVIGILVAWWLFGRGGKPKVRDHRPDVLDEGAAPAQRNQALIDAPPAAAMVPSPLAAPPAAGTLDGIGEMAARAARREVREAPEPGPPAAAIPLQEAAPPAGEGDDLRRIKGLGPKLVTTLQALGVTRYAQIADWTDADLDELDTKLGAFAGRPRRDSWVEQAGFLAADDTAAYEAKFGKL